MFLKMFATSVFFAIVLSGCATTRIGVTPKGHVYGEVMTAHNQGQFRPQPMLAQQNNVIIQRGGGSYQQPRFCADHHSNSSGCYGGGNHNVRQGQQQHLVKECRPHGAGRMCRMVPPHMVGH